MSTWYVLPVWIRLLIWLSIRIIFKENQWFVMIFIKFTKIICTVSNVLRFLSIMPAFVDWLIDFNGVSTSLGLFNAKGFRNCVHIYIFCIVVYFFRIQFNWIQIIFRQNNWTQRWDFNRYYHSRTEWQSGPGSNGNDCFRVPLLHSLTICLTDFSLSVCQRNRTKNNLHSS